MENPNTWRLLEKTIYRAAVEYSKLTDKDIYGHSPERYIADKIREKLQEIVSDEGFNLEEPH